jgi:hypothetical protein
MESTMNRLVRIEDQRFMVSPCGYMSDWFDAAEIADECPGWTDATELSDTEIGQMMVRRMREADQRKREDADEDRAERAQWHRDYDLMQI